MSVKYLKVICSNLPRGGVRERINSINVSTHELHADLLDFS